jgi:alpha-acetolactate decarboxylase
VTVYVTPECEGGTDSLCEALHSIKSVDKPALEDLIKQTIQMYFKESKVLASIQEKTGFPLIYGSNDVLQKRELRKMQTILKEFREKMQETHVSKQNTEALKMRDIFLEEKVVTCLNQQEYNAYLYRLQKKQPESSEWE